MEKMFKIFVNFKTYPNGTGESAVELAKTMERVATSLQVIGDRLQKKDDDSGVELIPIVQAVDLWRVRQEVKLPVWMQHVDPYESGKFTGFTSLEGVVEAGAGGTLLNHSEHPIPTGTIKQTIARAGTLNIEHGTQGEGKRVFQTIVCCKTLGQIERLVKLNPDYIAYEIVELIAGGVSIAGANPKAVEHAVKLCGKIPLLVGAGVNNGGDLVVAKKLGAAGVLVANAVVNAEDQEGKLRELVNALTG